MAAWKGARSSRPLRRVGAHCVLAATLLSASIGCEGSSSVERRPAATAESPAREADRDADGVPDARDRCPSEPEDCDGFADDDGCPEQDVDGDGILDGCDACPREPETYQGMADEDGCPDVPRDDFGHPVHAFGGVRLLVAPATDADALAPLDAQTTDWLGRISRDYTDVHLGVLGVAHTNEAKPESLASRRAKALGAAIEHAGFARESIQVERAVVGPAELPRGAQAYVLSADGVALFAFRAGRFVSLDPPHEHSEAKNRPPPDPRCLDPKWRSDPAPRCTGPASAAERPSKRGPLP